MALQNYVTIHARLVYADLLVDRQKSLPVLATESILCKIAASQKRIMASDGAITVTVNDTINIVLLAVD